MTRLQCPGFALALALTLATACGGGKIAGGGGAYTVGGKPGNACDNLTQDMGCYFSPDQPGGKGTVVKCDAGSKLWQEIQACGPGFICKETAKPGGEAYIKLASCEVDAGPAGDGAGLADAATPTDGASLADAATPTDGAGLADAQAHSDGSGVGSPDAAGQQDADTSGTPVDVELPPADTAASVGCKGKCNTSSVDEQGNECWCDSACVTSEDCCPDKLLYCPKDPQPDVVADVDMPDTGADSSNGDVATDSGAGDGASTDAGTKPGTCKDRPCVFDGAHTCQCDDACAKPEYADCCADKSLYCPAGDG